MSIVITMFGSGNSDDNDRSITRFDNPDNGFVATYPSFVEVPILRTFSGQHANLNARFYIDTERRRTLIVAANMDLRKYHFIQSMIPRFLPWFFAEEPINEKEMSLLDSLTHRYSTDYEEIINEISGQIDYRSHMIKQIIGDFERRDRKDDIEKTERSIEEVNDHMIRLMNEYASKVRMLDDLNLRLVGLRIAYESAASESDLIDYFCCNKNITPIRVNGRSLTFIVKTYLESFDPEMYETYIKNPASHLYRNYDFSPEFSSVEARKKMMDAIFSDNPPFKVRMCANYTIDLGGGVSAHRFYDYGPEYNDYIRNPHIEQFACIGNYVRYINDYLKRGNTIAAIEQCIASAKSLNISEAPTTCGFLKSLFQTSQRVVELPDGRAITPSEALKYLYDLEVSNNEEVHNG